MTKTEIAEKIKNMISENLRIPENMLDDDAELFGGDIGLDSVDSLEIISGIDDLFGVDMTGVDREHFQTINALASYVEVPPVTTWIPACRISAPEKPGSTRSSPSRRRAASPMWERRCTVRTSPRPNMTAPSAFACMRPMRPCATAG